MSVVVRPAQQRDEPRWRELFDAYTRFYEREPDEAIAKHAWARIHDPKSPVYAAVAEIDGHVVRKPAHDGIDKHRCGSSFQTPDSVPSPRLRVKAAKSCAGRTLSLS